MEERTVSPCCTFNSFKSVSGFKIALPPLWLAVVLPLAYFTSAVLAIGAFGADTPGLGF